jgi:hypothetical protein
MRTRRRETLDGIRENGNLPEESDLDSAINEVKEMFEPSTDAEETKTEGQESGS